MAQLAEAQSGWINLYPEVLEEDLPPAGSPLLAIFSGLGPPVPECTWVAPGPKQKPPHPEIGIRHRAGPKAAKRLAEATVSVPDRWVVLADHPKRGLVVAVNPAAGHAEVLDWLLRAAGILTQVPLTGNWQAVVHAP